VAGRSFEETVNLLGKEVRHDMKQRLADMYDKIKAEIKAAQDRMLHLVGFWPRLFTIFTKLEEAIMSAITTYIDQLVAKVDALKASNDTLTAAAAQKDVDIATLNTHITDLQNQIATAQTQAAAAQAQLATAQANAFDPADVQKLQDLLAKLG